MPLKGGSFSVDTTQLDGVLKNIKNARAKIDKVTLAKMKAATSIVYRTASAKRPMMSKTQMKLEKRTRRVSDPNAQAGVPVQTGALRISITQSVTQKGDKTIGTVATKSPYASFVEFGTSKMAARPFMRPALALQVEAIKALFAKKP